MRRLIECEALGLVLCVVLPAVAADKPTRPHAYKASETFVIDLTTGLADYWGSGVATHFGQVNNAGTFLFDANLAFVGSGALTSASGDQIFWDAEGIMGGDVIIWLTGGTGRFAQVIGELNTFEVSNMQQVLEGDFLTITLDETATGWISYGGGQDCPYGVTGDWRLAVNIDPSSPEFGQVQELGIGVAIHRGRVIVEGTGQMDFQTGVYSAAGVATDASGDETWWWVEDVIGPTMVVHIDGGTGRFEGAVGELNAFELTDVVEEVQWPFLITTSKLAGKGWMIY